MPRADRSLRQHLDDSGPLEMAEASKILIDVADALAGLAGRNVVHRDLKPENVLLLDGRWCLADFGISRYAEATTAPDTQKFAMSRAYAAPERWRSIRATGAADVYSFGIMAYEMLVGERPFPGPGDDFREQHLHHDPPALDAAVGAALGALVGECLYKAQEARPSAANVLARLTKARNKPATGGLASLQAANRDEVLRLSQEARQASEAMTERERRDGLAKAAEAALTMIMDEVKETLRAAAPAAQVSAISGVWTLSFQDAMLQLARTELSPPGALAAFGSPGLIDVIAHSSLLVRMQQANTETYAGRSHSLWYCDAQEEGRFQWYETAFMDSPFLAQRSQLHPYALPPGEVAGEALSRVMGTGQLAHPFTPLVSGDLDEFIGRWAEWFAMAAARTMQHPALLPEGSPDGSYRR